MGIVFMASMAPGEQDRLLGRVWRRTVEGEQHAPNPLEGCQRLAPMRATPEIALEVELADRENRGHQQVPDAGDDRELDHLIGCARNLLRTGEQFWDRGNESERAGLQHRNGFVPGRRD